MRTKNLSFEEFLLNRNNGVPFPDYSNFLKNSPEILDYLKNGYTLKDVWTYLKSEKAITSCYTTFRRHFKRYAKEHTEECKGIIIKGVEIKKVREPLRSNREEIGSKTFIHRTTIPPPESFFTMERERERKEKERLEKERLRKERLEKEKEKKATTT